MANTLTALTPDVTRRRIIRRNQVTLTGNFPGAAGEPLDLSNILNPNWVPNSNYGTVPALADMEVYNVPAGYDAAIIAGTGTTLATSFALVFYTTAGALLPTAAYPAALTAAAAQIQIRTTQRLGN
jgi:hypothetical protein